MNENAALGYLLLLSIIVVVGVRLSTIYDRKRKDD